MSEDSTEFSDDVDDGSDPESYRAEFSPEHERASVAVTTAIAAITGRRQDKLDPLYDAIDPDALDSLFQPTHGRTRMADVVVSFRYYGFDVTVRSTGVIEIERDGD